MLHVVLYQPEIPPNTGNIIRLCANTGATLHLIHPLGFSLEEKLLRRAGLDYHEWCDIHEYTDYEHFLGEAGPKRLLAFTTRGMTHYSDHAFEAGDALLFGPETRGLPESILATLAENRRLRIPMRDHSRSINLSNTVAIGLYEAWRQLGFYDLTS
jgi:tRNA (cytidine/uridine-2'-O-)-methyltransferase